MPKNNPMVILLALLVPIYVGRVQEMAPFLEDLYLAKLGIALAVVGFARSFRRYYRENLAIRRLPQVKYLALLPLFALLSAPFGHWPGGSVDFIVSSYLKLLVFTMLLICCVESETDLQLLCLSLVGTALLIDLSALINPKVVENGRISAGGTYDPNDMALVLVMALPPMFYMMEKATRFRKLILLGGMLLTLMVIVKTGSRGGFLALLAVVGMISWHKGTAYVVRRIPLFLLALVLVVGFAPDAQLERLKTITATEHDYNTQDKTGRIEIWKRGLSIMMDNPLLGCGISQFAVVNGRMPGSNTWLTAHNSLVQLGAEQGVGALVVFLLLIRSSMRSLKRGEQVFEKSWLPRAIRTSMVAFCVGGFFLSWAYHQATYFIFALGIIVAKISLRSKSDCAPQPSAAAHSFALRADLPVKAH